MSTTDTLEQPTQVIDPIESFKAARKLAMAELEQVERRATELRKVLGLNGSHKPPQRVRTAPVRPHQAGLSLREAVEQVTRNKPLTKREILAAVRRIGYKFTTKDPMNSLNALIYLKDENDRPYFQRHGEGVGARFSAR